MFIDESGELRQNPKIAKGRYEVEPYRKSVRNEILPEHGIFENEPTKDELKDFDKGVVARVFIRALKGTHKKTFYTLFMCVKDWDAAAAALKIEVKTVRQYANEARDQILPEIRKSPELKEWLTTFKKNNPEKGKFVTL